MVTTFWHSVKQLRRVQDLVKRYDGRFVHNPLVMRDTALVEISFDDIHNGNMFSLMRHILQQKFF